MVDPTAIQATAKEREIKGLLKLCCETSRTRSKLRKFSDAIYFGEQALLHCHELGNKKEAQNLHRKLLLYYISQSNHILLAQGGDSEEALQSAKLALKQSKGVEGEESRRSACKSLALVFLELQDFGEASINREEWLSYFEENDDTEEKHDAQWTKWTMNKQFKEASDDGEQALVSYKDDGEQAFVSYKDDKSLTIKIRWLLVLAYFLQNDFKDALEQFNSEPNMLSLKLDVDDYIKAGKIHHQKMRRYNEAKMCFEKAKKDANSKLKSIQKANESIKDDVSQMIKNIGEIDIEKHGNKKEIEEQTFCHTEENIEKEASGDEGGPHTEDITKEQCEVLDAERTPFFEKLKGIRRTLMVCFT